MPLRCCKRRLSSTIVPVTLTVTTPVPTIQDEIERTIAEHRRFYHIHLHSNITYTITPDYIHTITEQKARFIGLINSALDVCSESRIKTYQDHFNRIDIRIYTTLYKLFKDGRVRFTKDTIKIPYVREYILTSSGDKHSFIYS